MSFRINSCPSYNSGSFLLTCFLYFFIGLSFVSAQTGTLIPIGEGYGGTSVNTAVFRGSSIVSDDSLQYVAYYNPEGYVMLAKRFLNDTVFTFRNTGLKGKVEDAHNIISLGIDGEGFLHMSFDHHGDPLKYCRSVAPGSLEMSNLIPMTGQNEGNVTYPEFYSMPDGNLLFTYRDGESGNGNLVLNLYDIASKEWKRVQNILIDGESQRNPYWQIYVDTKGTIHLSWVWRESWLVETNHDLCYARSEDNGKTWLKSDGSIYELPITIDTAELAWEIPQNSELINQTSMTADSFGNPYISTYWRDKDNDVPQYRIVWNDGEKWKMDTVGHRTTPFSLSGGGTKMIPISRPRIASDGMNAFYFFRDEERSSRVSMGFSPDINNCEWRIIDLTDFSVDAWEPNFDINLWNRKKKLNIFIQTTHQGDGERLSSSPETKSMVYILELNTPL